MGEVMTMIHTLAVTGSTDFSFFEILMMMAMPLVVAAFLIGYSKLAESKGWIGWRPGEPEQANLQVLL